MKESATQGLIGGHIVDGGGAGLFAELVAVGVADDLDVTVGGRRVAERLLNGELAGCGFEQIVPSDHVSDVLEVIVDDDGQLIGEVAVGP